MEYTGIPKVIQVQGPSMSIFSLGQFPHGWLFSFELVRCQLGLQMQFCSCFWGVGVDIELTDMEVDVPLPPVCKLFVLLFFPVAIFHFHVSDPRT